VGSVLANVVVTAPTRTSRRDGRADEKALFRIDLVLVLDGAGRKAGLADAHRSVQRPTAKGCAEGARQTIRRRYLSDSAKVYGPALERQEDTPIVWFVLIFRPVARASMRF
jgi:hypothetical protein